MKIMKNNIITIITILFGSVLLILQKPVTDAILNNKVKTISSVVPNSEYSIKNIYNLPPILNEISGLTWLNKTTFACVQDEDGILFIYDTQKNKIIEQFKFAAQGDYEGLTVNKKDAYVMRSDGVVFEIKNYRSKNKKITEFKTPFSSKNNIESLTFDEESNRLLTIAKDRGLGNENVKSIYQIPLKSKIMDQMPVIKIDLTSNILKKFEHKKIYKTLNPSDLAIHPKSKDIYVLEGKHPKLLILNNNGDLKKVLTLNKNDFAQPEGITFSNEGKLFISNEANKNNANILEVVLK